MQRFFVSLLLASLGAFGADIAGNWKATAEGPNGSMSRTFSFKIDGTKLTGETVSSMVGKSTIEKGKIEGDSISFVLQVKFQDNDITVSYSGKVTGKDEIKLSADTGQGTIEWVAKRAS